MRVHVLPALADNYIFALADAGLRRAVLVDPGEASPALGFLEREGLGLEAILITHHHRDHVGGLRAILSRFPATRVVGPAQARGRIAGLTELVSEDQRVELLGRTARVLEVPGHTLDHVAYFIADEAEAGDLFSGDTVFGGTIGNLFEGTPDVMYASMVKIRALPPRTRLWCAHEYTLEQVRVAAGFDRENPRLRERLARLEAAAGSPSVPLTLDEERATNPFFRWDDPQLLRRIGTPPGLPAFRRLCELL